MPYRQLEINYPIFTPLASIVCARDVNGSDSVYMCFETSVILLFLFLEYGHLGVPELLAQRNLNARTRIEFDRFIANEIYFFS